MSSSFFYPFVISVAKVLRNNLISKLFPTNLLFIKIN